MSRYFQHEGQWYLRIGDKAIPVDKEGGKPVVKTESVVTPNADGGQDVTIKVPCLQISSKATL